MSLEYKDKAIENYTAFLQDKHERGAQTGPCSLADVCDSVEGPYHWATIHLDMRPNKALSQQFRRAKSKDQEATLTYQEVAEILFD